MGGGGVLSISTEPSVHGPTRVMDVVPVPDGQRVWEVPLIHRVNHYLVRGVAKTNFTNLVIFIPVGYLPTPTKERISGVRNRVIPQPSAGIVLARFGVYSGSGGRQSQNAWAVPTTYPQTLIPPRRFLQWVALVQEIRCNE